MFFSMSLPVLPRLMFTGALCHVSPPSLLRPTKTLRFSERPPSCTSHPMCRKYRVLSRPMDRNDIGMRPLSWVHFGNACGAGEPLAFTHVRPPSPDRSRTHAV